MKRTTYDKLETVFTAIMFLLLFFVIPVFAPPLIDKLFTAIGL